MSALKKLSRRVRLALHRRELTALGASAAQTGCVYCTSWQGEPHDPWCPRAGTR